MAVAHQPAGHVRPHPTESDHPQLHGLTLRDPSPVETGTDSGSLASRWPRQQRRTDDAAADVLTIFGISGDLAKKMTFRALYRLEARGRARAARSSASRSTTGTTSSCASTPREAIDDTVEQARRRRPRTGSRNRLTYVQGDYADAATFEKVGKAIEGRRPAGLLPRGPPLPLRHRRPRPRRRRASPRRPGRDREALRPRPRVGAGAERRALRGARARSRSCASTITSARSR